MLHSVKAIFKKKIKQAKKILQSVWCTIIKWTQAILIDVGSRHFFFIISIVFFLSVPVVRIQIILCGNLVQIMTGQKSNNCKNTALKINF